MRFNNEKDYTNFFILLVSTTFVFSYDDLSGATYAGKSYEMDLDYAIQELKNRYIRENKKSGQTVYKIEKLTNNETRLLNNALSEYKLEKDDVYTVQIGEVSTTPMRILKLVVRIDKVYNNGHNWTYKWWSIGKIYY